jgi:hypothetical protein
MNQIFLGALVPFFVLSVLYAWRRGRASLLFLLMAPLWIAAGAIWAVVPDIPRLLGMEGLYERLSHDPRMNIFLWHYTIDQIEGEWFPYHIPLVLMFVLLLIAAWRELRLCEEKGQ